MKIRTTVLLLVIAVATGLFIWFFERHVGDTNTREHVARLVVNLDPERVDQLEIQTTNYLVVCERKGKVWTMIQPMRTRASGGEIQKILAYVEEWGRHETIRTSNMKKNQFNATTYGVDTPRLKLSFRSDGKEQVIHIGDNTALSEGLYVKLEGKNDIIAASTNIWSVIPDEVTQFRSRRVFDGVPTDVQRIRFKRSDGVLDVHRSETYGWLLKRPRRGRADVPFVNDLLFEFFGAGIEQFVFDEVSELSPYGLDSPRARVSLWMGDDRRPQVLMLGDAVKGDDSLVYAMRKGENSVVAINKDLYVSATMNANVLRDRRLLDMDERAVSYIHIEAGEEALSLQKDDAGSWYLVQPVQHRAQDDLVWDLVAMWAQAGIQEFVADDVVDLAEYGLTKPAFSIEFYAQPPTNQTLVTTHALGAAPGAATEDVRASVRVALGSVEPDKQQLFVQVGDKPSVQAVDVQMLKRLSVTPVFYYHREVLALVSDDVLEIKLQTGDLIQTVVRDERGEFNIAEESNTNHSVLVSNQVATVLQEMRSLVVRGFVAKNPDDLALYGLATPHAELTVGLTGEAGISKSLITGVPFDEHGVFAMIRGQDVVFVLPLSSRDRLMAPLYTVPEPSDDEEAVSPDLNLIEL